MGKVENVTIGNKSLEHFLELLGRKRTLEFEETLDQFQSQLGPRVFWHVNSTAKGGGVAEMLPHILGYMRDSGIDTRWLTIPGTPEFFTITKRLHHTLHGSVGDGSPLGRKQHKIYRSVLIDSAKQILERVGPEDVIILHDPQTAGLLPLLKGKVGALVWRCHIGHDERNFTVDLGWSFLAPYLAEADAYIFSRESYIPHGFDQSRCFIIPPSIDPLSPKNEPLDSKTVKKIMSQIGMLAEKPENGAAEFERSDGSLARVTRQADIVREDKAPKARTPLLVQISRWDPLKDHPGVMKGFEKLLLENPEIDAHLALVGPDVKSVADDPEGAQVYEEVEDVWKALPDEIRSRVHLLNLPMNDVEENAAMVNAIQRHATIVIQKSLQEGFGLTVTEAMWKGKPMIASAVGGIQDQIEDGNSGILLEDPRDTDELVAAMKKLLTDKAFCKQLGKNAKNSVIEHFLIARHLRQYLEVLEYVDEQEELESDLLAG